MGEAALRATERIIGDEALALDAVGAPAVGMNRVIVVVVVGTGRGEASLEGQLLTYRPRPETRDHTVVLRPR